MKSYMKRIMLALGLLSILGIVVACSNDGGESGSDGSSTSGGSSDSGDEIIIGVTNPLSGPLAEMGQDIQEGIKLAIELKNEEGGIDGKQIKVVEADVPEPSDAKTEIERLIHKEKVDLIIGTYGSSTSIAVSEITAQNAVPYFEIVSLANTISNRQYEHVYRINPEADKFTEVAKIAIQELIPEKLGVDLNDLKVALIHEDTDNGTSWMDSFEEVMEQEGLSDLIKMRESYSAQTNDMSSLILKLDQAKPDVLVASSYLNDAVQFVRQSKELGVNYPVLMGGGAGWGQPGLVEALGELTEGILDIEYAPLPPLANAEAMPGIEEFVEAYKEKHGKDPDGVYTHASYSSAKSIMEILEEAESISAEDIKVAAFDLKKDWWTSESGWGIDFEEDGEYMGQNRNTAPYLTQWIDGELTVVSPEEISVIEPIIPKPEW